MGRLVSLRHAVSAGARLPGGCPLGRPRRRRGRREKGDLETELIPLSVPEVRRLVLAMAAGSSRERNFRLGWSLGWGGRYGGGRTKRLPPAAKRPLEPPGTSSVEGNRPRNAPLRRSAYSLPKEQHRSPTKSGRCSGLSSHTSRQRAAPTTTIAPYWGASCGWRGRARLGERCLKSSASGRPLTGATSCG